MHFVGHRLIKETKAHQQYPTTLLVSLISARLFATKELLSSLGALFKGCTVDDISTEEMIDKFRAHHLQGSESWVADNGLGLAAQPCDKGCGT